MIKPDNYVLQTDAFVSPENTVNNLLLLSLIYTMDYVLNKKENFFLHNRLLGRVNKTITHP